MTGEVPFKDLKYSQIIEKKTCGEYPEIINLVPNMYKQLIERC